MLLVFDGRGAEGAILGGGGKVHMVTGVLKNNTYCIVLVKFMMFKYM